MKKINYYLTSLILMAVLLAKLNIPTVSAQEATEEANKATDSATTQNLKERIEKIVEEKKVKIEETLEEMSGKKQGYVGEIIRVTEETITVESLQGTKIVPLKEDLIILKKGKTIPIGNIAVGDWVSVIGKPEDNTIIPQRVIVSTKNLQPRVQQITLGTIQTITKTSLTVQSRANQNEATYAYNKETQLEDLNGEKIKLALLSEDIQCLIVGYQNEEGAFVATTIKLLTTAEVLTDEENDN